MNIGIIHTVGARAIASVAFSSINLRKLERILELTMRLDTTDFTLVSCFPLLSVFTSTSSTLRTKKFLHSSRANSSSTVNRFSPAWRGLSELNAENRPVDAADLNCSLLARGANVPKTLRFFADAFASSQKRRFLRDEYVAYVIPPITAMAS